MANKFSMIKRGHSFKYAFKGIIIVLKSQHNAWIHLAITVMVIIFGIIYPLTLTEWLLIIFAIGFVLVAEACNTAIEKLVDLVSPEHNDKAGQVKDMAAGAVLIAAITAAVIGLIIFVPKVF